MLALVRRHPILAAVLLILGVALGSAAAATYRAGLVRVSVEEKRPGGEKVKLFVPGILLTTALRLVPEKTLQDELRDARPWLPVAAALTKQLQNYPDASFVEVSNPQEQVRLSTRGGVLVVDVSSPDETVHVSVPLATLADLTAELSKN
ncbi:MAG TPA: hypothetical protein VNN18_08870 [Candidatus Xenobia bacterium]|nr:hypothetical protein [Candidatus Xenobia bacterium]